MNGLFLSSGDYLPEIGLGLYKVQADKTEALVSHALEVGYRLIDGASFYENEAQAGKAIRESGIPREEIFATSKFWLEDLGYQKTKDAFHKSLELMGLDYLDSYMIHWPAPKRDLYIDSWRAMIELREQGLIRSLGVSNFHSHHLQRIFDEFDEYPVINQVELHPWLIQKQLREFHTSHGIVTQSWSPLARGQLLEEPTVLKLAESRGVSVAQLIIRWHIQIGSSVIPKSNSKHRISENFDVFGFELGEHEMKAISSLDRGYRTGVDPEDRN
jgi:2,5-diketo-D-gluconate reductase A